jgi:squalene-hopene/tetraprenyl-beta-curcumene cyclase
VANWQGIDHYYSDAGHYTSSRATESVLNAVILSQYDSDSNHLGSVTRQAFDEAWALQLTSGPNTGGWDWQSFHEAPWESSESAYQGAAMIAVALGSTPAQYQGEPEVRDHVLHLREYLLGHYAAQPTLNRLYVMWASARPPGLLTVTQRNELFRQVTKLQNPDGGWSLSALDRQHSLKDSLLDLFKQVDRVDGSDGCATGIVVLAFEENGVPVTSPALQKGLTWLEQHQYQDGSWWASSMNGFRDPKSYMGKFMSDAATGYATLAIERSMNPQTVSVQAAASNSVRAFPVQPGNRVSAHDGVAR